MKILQKHKILGVINHSFSKSLSVRPRLLNRKFFSEVIEVTGSPGSGKTTWIRSFFSGQFILLGAIPLSFGTYKRVLYSIALSFYALSTGAISFRQIWWLVKKAANYDENLFSRVNALRNGMIKFGYHYFGSKNNSIIVDEGISHIPFILGLKDEDIDDFIILFRQKMVNTKIFFIDAPKNKILSKRIVTRGHKRVRSENEAECFVKKNVKIAIYYKRALIDAGFDVTVI